MKKDLMQPRYKVIGEWPYCRFLTNDVLNRIPRATESIFAKEDWQPGSPYINEDWLIKYPHLFKKLEWWEDRKPEDMPEYIKLIETKPTYNLPVGSIRNVTAWEQIANGTSWICDVFPVYVSVKHTYPATLEEYTAYHSTPTP